MRPSLKRIFAVLGAACLTASIVSVPVLAEGTDETDTQPQTTEPQEEAEEKDEPSEPAQVNEPDDGNDAEPEEPVQEKLEIVTEPADATVEYPNGAQFHVEVNHPELVASYQWTLSDGITVFTLEGTSAKTDTLVIPATDYAYQPYYLCCTITDIFGNKIYTRDAELITTNPDEYKPVLYIGEYAVEPGEILDLSEKGMGKGEVVFAADGYNITLDNVEFRSDYQKIYDDILAMAPGILLNVRGVYHPEYYLHVKGSCDIFNSNYDFGTEQGGVALNVHFGCADDANKPSLIIDGDGALRLVGGRKIIYTDGELEIATRLTALPYTDNISDAVTAHNVYIDENVLVALTANGTGVDASGDFYLENGATLLVNLCPRHTDSGPTSLSGLYAAGNMNCGAGTIKITGNGSPDHFIPFDRFLSALRGINCQRNMNFNGTDIDIEFANAPGIREYSSTANGIFGAEKATIDMTNGARININVDAPETVNASGITISKVLNISEGCSIDMNVSARNNVYGIHAYEGVVIDNADVNVRIESSGPSESAGEDEPYNVIGINTTTANLSEAGAAQIHVTAKNGVAITAGDEGTETTPEHEEGYEPKYILLSEDTEITKPKNEDISVYGKHEGLGLLLVETVYDISKEPVPASEIIIQATGEWDDPTYTWSKDNLSVTAERINRRDKSLSEKETVKATVKVTKQPTKTSEGEEVFTAEFENPAFETQAKTVIIPAGGKPTDPGASGKTDNNSGKSGTKGPSDRPNTYDTNAIPRYLVMMVSGIMAAIAAAYVLYKDKKKRLN